MFINKKCSALMIEYTYIYIYIYKEREGRMVGFGESDKMIKISGKGDKFKHLQWV